MPEHGILVVDGDVETAVALRCYLEKDGWHVFLARDGSEALSLLRRKQPHIILLDWSLLKDGGMDPGWLPPVARW